MFSPDSEDRKTTRPQRRCIIAGRYARDSRTPDMTLTSKKRVHSLSGISKKSRCSKIPTLLTRISATGSAFTRAAQPAVVPRSAAMPRKAAPGTARFSLASAASTPACLRPFTTTAAPASARPWAMAKPIPAVEPVTMAILSERSIFMGHLLLDSVLGTDQRGFYDLAGGVARQRCNDLDPLGLFEPR